MFSPRLPRIIALILVAILLTANFTTNTPSTLAQGIQGKNPTVVATKDGITIPKDLAAGIVMITLQNDTKAAFTPILARLNKGKTLQDFKGAMQKGPAEAIAVVTILGGPEVAAATSADVTYDFLAGDYILLNLKRDGPPDVQPFKVDENKNAVTKEPEADVIITLVDFAFTMPGTLKGGTQTIKIANAGKQPHEIIAFHVPDDAKLDDVKAALLAVLKSAQGQSGPPKMPYEAAYTWIGMSPDMRAWVKVDLAPGRYAIVCFIPDVTSTSKEMVSHLEHGMITLVTVSK